MKENLEIQEISKYEMYEDLMNEMKKRLAIDQGTLDEEVLNLLTEIKQEIISLRTGINKLQDDNLKYKNYCGIMARQLYVNYRMLDIKSDEAEDKIKRLLLSSDDDVINYDQADLDRIIKEIGND